MHFFRGEQGFPAKRHLQWHSPKKNERFPLKVFISEKEMLSRCRDKDPVTVMLMHHSVVQSPLVVGGVRDHNIILRQEGTCWWNMREAEGHWTSVNINTNTSSQNDWLPLRACCEKSIQSNHPLSPNLYMRAHNLSCTSPWGVQNVQSLKYYQWSAVIVISVLCGWKLHVTKLLPLVSHSHSTRIDAFSLKCSWIFSGVPLWCRKLILHTAVQNSLTARKWRALELQYRISRAYT